MPWAIEQRGDEWCVVKEGEEKPVACHASRSRALAQQRALYAQEATMASAEGNGSVRLELTSPASDLDESLVASIKELSEHWETVAEQLATGQQQLAEALAALEERISSDRADLTDALTAAVERPDPPAPEPPVVNVTVPEPVVTVNVPEAAVNVTAPTPVVNVTMPAARREIRFDRDPATGDLRGAEVTEME